MTDQISSDSQFSVGRAVVGTAMLGGIGAIGGLTGKRNYTPRIMIISFMENNDTNYMVFLQKIPKSGKVSELKLHGNLLEHVCGKMSDIINNIKN